MKVVLVIGLPASGKTTWAQARVNEDKAKGIRVELLDDPRSPSDLMAALGTFRSPCGAREEVLYITDPHLCDPQTETHARGVLASLSLEVEAVYFSNDPVQCQRNARARLAASSNGQPKDSFANGEPKNVATAIEQWSKLYRPPKDALSVVIATRE